ncbi:uncharacterized protein M421DRAFT_90204 [Didymella exigua CBS 183.55]|uniref:Uncharacterized protein n=1 Tax=Didymella exigua CBS 183.55 TaxID=1150837 RepID=A0A6A5RXT3_9PLEO|nr:uncharacterized protein M421DRAFT_90204 [Didymella exigua CBS 183.55]KAF1931106.1 hypothetical protein M421DRAFT_90204 [Didymella exigua CBS 183.55]
MKTFHIVAGILVSALSVQAETDCQVGANYCGWYLSDHLGWSTTPMKNDIQSIFHVSVDDQHAKNYMYHCNAVRQASPTTSCSGNCQGPIAHCVRAAPTVSSA